MNQWCILRNIVGIAFDSIRRLRHFYSAYDFSDKTGKLFLCSHNKDICCIAIRYRVCLCMNQCSGARLENRAYLHKACIDRNYNWIIFDRKQKVCKYCCDYIVFSLHSFWCLFLANVQNSFVIRTHRRVNEPILRYLCRIQQRNNSKCPDLEWIRIAYNIVSHSEKQIQFD